MEIFCSGLMIFSSRVSGSLRVRSISELLDEYDLLSTPALIGDTALEVDSDLQDDFVLKERVLICGSLSVPGDRFGVSMAPGDGKRSLLISKELFIPIRRGISWSRPNFDLSIRL